MSEQFSITNLFPVTLDGRLFLDEYEDHCDVCRQPVNKNKWGQTGGDGFNGCGIMDHPVVSECEFCGAEYLDGERL